MIRLTCCFAFACTVLTITANADDWPMWGRDATRNMVSTDTGIPKTFKPGPIDYDTEVIDQSKSKNIRWISKMGSQTYGNPTVASGRVFIGTNNEYPRIARHKGDRGIVLCLDEKTGAFQWQLTVPKLGAGKVSDWEYLGICSSPLIDGKFVYIITNRCEVVCVDIDGMKNGNQGVQDEGQYMAGSGKPPVEVGDDDADIIWRFDMRAELGVFPHNITSSSPAVVGNTLFVTTSNGQDWSHVNIPAPNAPCLIVLDKNTGALLGEEASGISHRLFHCNWSSPAHGNVGSKPQVVFGAGDGFCYGFNPAAVKDEDGYGILQERWRFDCNPAEYKTVDGKPVKYASAGKGPSEIIATPVIYKNRVYVCTGQDPEHGQGLGNLSCIDASGSGDISKTGVIWRYKDLHRAISTVAIHDDLVYAADYTGRLHCVDAITGKVYWVHDTQSNIWGSPLVVDGRVYLGNEDGYVTVVETGKTLKKVAEVDLYAPLYSSPIAANKTLYIATQTHLFAIGK
jgi:outer membrane protein assembly factor BamB